MTELLQKIIDKCRQYADLGEVATYIPELAHADRRDIGIAITDGSGNTYTAADSTAQFTMQSIVKPVILLLALMDNGFERVRSLVGVEATGKPFDSFNYSDLALTGDHINPMVNTGAIALCSLISGESYDEKLNRLLSLVRKLAGNESISVCERVYLSEKATGNKNRALAYLLKAYGLIDCDAEAVVDLYFKACSISVSCADLSRIGYTFAAHGLTPSGERVFSERYARYVNAMLTICGMYDGSGTYAIKVGIPTKSGVGGGLLAVSDKRAGIGVFSPALDAQGNSVAGCRLLKEISNKLRLDLFYDPEWDKAMEEETVITDLRAHSIM
jgi:glutaminase